MRLHRLESVHLPVQRTRFFGVGVTMLGAVGLGLAVAPACGGGGSTGENVVHPQSSAAHVVLAAADESIAPDCGGGGATGDD